MGELKETIYTSADKKEANNLCLEHAHHPTSVTINNKRKDQGCTSVFTHNELLNPSK
jgi:hypothetical protein